MAVSEQDLLFELSCLQRRTARKRFRQDILEAWDHRCAYCGSERAPTLDHVLAKAKGGPTKRANLVAACATCNLLKSSADWLEWFRVQDFWDLSRETQIFQWLADNHEASIAAREYEQMCKYPIKLPVFEPKAEDDFDDQSELDSEESLTENGPEES